MPSVRIPGNFVWKSSQIHIMISYFKKYIGFTILLSILVVAVIFSLLFPASVLTSGWRIHHVEYKNICYIQANSQGKGFIIDYQDGRQILVDRESYNSFLRRADFNIRPLSKFYEKSPDGLLFNKCRLSEATTTTECNPYVKGINVFYIRGFIKVNSQMFVVIYGDGDFEDCNCNDPKVILGKKPYCKLVYHSTKKDIISRARECGLGDYFPEKSC